jgi:predicted O-linked N-acetylglucosamine transferase (SPINDLY family)
LSIIPFFNKDINFYKEHARKYRESIKVIDNNLLDNFFIDKNLRNRKIKLGFLSSDLRAHPTGYYLLDVIKEIYKNNNIELYAFSDSNFKDNYTRELKSYFHSWHDVASVSEIKLINIIRNLGINILVDMQGHTYGNRLSIFASKAAPIQISWASYLASTGMIEIDYVIADKYSVTSNEEKQFVEKIWRLNNTWSVIKPENDINLNQELPMTKNNYVTFGSFNEIKKINKKVIELWSRILRNSHNSKLILISKKFNEQKFKDRFTNFFIKNGVNLNQLLFEGEQERRKLLIKYNYIDIALDTFPYNGGTTSLEAAWMCVPILVMKGKSFLSKCGESINFSLGMDEWICDDEESYVKKALFFSKDLKKLQETKDYLIKNRSKFGIFDGKKLSNELSHAFQEMINIKNSKC